MTLKEELENEMEYRSFMTSILFIDQPKHYSILNIANGTLVIESTKPMPNPIWRFFQWVLLGFKWSKP